MALSPEDIVNHEFKQALRGYAVQEVDDLLDRLADQLERAERDIADLRQRVSDADARATEALATESSLKRTLITAQDAAQRTMDDAQAHAETVRADADREATERLDEAYARSAAMVREAETEASTARASYRSEQEASATRIAELAAIEDRYRTQLRALLEHQLGEIERLEATGAPGGPEVDELRSELHRGAFDAGVDAEASDTGEDQDLVPFGGLTVRVRDGAVSSDHEGRNDDHQDHDEHHHDDHDEHRHDDHERGDSDRDALA